MVFYNEWLGVDKAIHAANVCDKPYDSSQDTTFWIIRHSIGQCVRTFHDPTTGSIDMAELAAGKSFLPSCFIDVGYNC